MTQHLDLYTVGTGAVSHTPLWGCTCAVCTRARDDSAYARKPCGGVLTFTDGNAQNHILLDAGDMDITTKYPRDSILGIVMTHYHPDHAQGLLPIRWHGGDTIPVTGVQDDTGFADVYKNNGNLDFSFVTPFETFEFCGVQFTPVPLIHSVPTNGYVIVYNGTKCAYLCDTCGLPSETEVYLKGLDLHTVILDCAYSPNYTSSGHCNVNQAVAIYDVLRPKNMILTHISHEFDVWLENNAVPTPLRVARDNQHIMTF